jgi:hypothetical protein
MMALGALRLAVVCSLLYQRSMSGGVVCFSQQPLPAIPVDQSRSLKSLGEGVGRHSNEKEGGRDEMSPSAGSRRPLGWRSGAGRVKGKSRSQPCRSGDWMCDCDGRTNRMANLKSKALTIRMRWAFLWPKFGLFG